jgi:hypothetical protein
MALCDMGTIWEVALWYNVTWLGRVVIDWTLSVSITLLGMKIKCKKLEGMPIAV